MSNSVYLCNQSEREREKKQAPLSSPLYKEATAYYSEAGQPDKWAPKLPLVKEKEKNTR